MHDDIQVLCRPYTVLNYFCAKNNLINSNKNKQKILRQSFGNTDAIILIVDDPYGRRMLWYMRVGQELGQMSNGQAIMKRIASEEYARQ